MDPSETDLQNEMARRVRRHTLFSMLGVVTTLAALVLVWLGSDAVFHGAVPKAFGLVYVGIFFIPVAVGIASARINLRCPACDARWGVRMGKTCPGCQKRIFA